MWLLEQLVPDSGVNNLSFTFRIKGALSVDVIDDVIRALVRRHDVLRTVFRGAGASVTKEVLLPEDAEAGVEARDSSAAALAGDLAAFVAKPFALDGEDDELPVRAALFRLGDAQVFCFAAHHLIVDSMSMAILRDEVIRDYDLLLAGKPLSVERVRALPEPAQDEAGVAFWRSRLEGYVPPESSLWLAKPEVDEPTLRGGAVQRDLSDAARDAVRRLRGELRAPDSVILLAAYYLLLGFHGAGSDLIVGSPVSTRPTTALSAIGYHVNLLPLRTQVDPSKGFRALVSATRTTFLEGMAHASVPAELLVGRAERTWRSPLFRYLFNYVPYLPGGTGIGFRVGGLPAEQVIDVENGASRFDLEFFCPPFPSADRIRIRAVYREQVLTREAVELLLTRYDELLVRVGADMDSPIEGWAPPPPTRAAAPAAPVIADAAAPDWVVEKLLAIWREMLKTDAIDADANFFASGGNSLKGALLVQRIKKALDIKVKLADLFANPTPRTLAGRLRDRLPADAPARS